MTYYNENDGLYYEDENFTTLANGWVDGVYYIDGHSTTLGPNGNGFDYNYYWAYFIGGVATTLNGDGFGTWNDMFYALGSPNLNYTGPDYWDYVYYVESQLTSLDIHGNGEWNGDTYTNGIIIINGWVDGVYYINNVATTLDSTGSGTWNGNPYVNGERQYNGLTDGLQAFYKFDDLTDSSGNGNTLTNNGDVTFSSGKVGNAAVFDGTSYLDTTVSLDNSSSFSLACWVDCTSSPNGDGAILGSMTDGNERAVIFGYSDNNSYSSLNTTNDGYVQLSGPTFVSQGWKHLTLTYDGSVAKMYVDGAVYSEAACSGTVNAEPLIRIGADGNGGSNLIGSVDAAGIWNRALNSAEVAELYNSGTGYEIQPPAPSGALSVKIQGSTKFFGKVKFA